MRQTQQRNFLFFLAIAAYISVSPSAAAEALMRPSLSLTSPDGGLVRLSECVAITKGHRFVFTCTVNSNYTPEYFTLRLSGFDLKSEKTQKQSASFVFSEADYKHQGNYSCVYNVTRNGTSQASESKPHCVTIVTFPQLILIISVVGGMVLLLVMAGLTVCLVCRRRKAKQPDAVILNQGTVRNSYEDDTDVEEEEEGDYVNINSEDNILTSPAKEDDDDEDDYEKVDDGVMMQSVTVEDEEEGSGDENDYVNLAESPQEEDGDISEDSDVYENL